MKQEKIEKLLKDIKTLKWWESWIGITIGSAIVAAGFVYFINPYNIVPGGVYGSSIVLHNIFPSIQVGTFGYMFDIPLFFIALLLLGANLGARTFYSAMITPTFMNLMTILSYPNQDAVESLNPSLLLDGHIDMSNDLMLTTIIGAALIGIGCGIVVKNEATTGGSDIVAMILQKYAHIKFSNAILLVDGFVVLFGLLVIGLGIGQEEGKSSGSWLLSFYSLLAIFISSRVLAYVIINDLNRTATLLKAQGLYTKQDKELIFLVVKYKEVNKVKQQIKDVDPTAFVIVTDAYDTFGEGWKELPDAGQIQAE